MTMKKILLGGAGAALLAGAIVAGVTYMHAPSDETATNTASAPIDATRDVSLPAITVAKATTETFIEYTNVIGSLVAFEEILVSPQVEGLRVTAFNADVGSVVKKGDILARLDAEQLEAQMAQNAASLARSDAMIAQAKSAIVQAEAQSKEAEAQLARAEPLKKSGYLSGSVYDQRESAARTAEAQLVAARDALTAAEAEKAQVLAQKRELAWRLSNTEVRAPADGIVSSRSARLGSVFVNFNNEPLFRIIQDGAIELNAEIVETQLPKIKVGQKAKIRIPGGRTFEGKVRLISPTIDPTTRLGQVRIFIGADPALHIGAFAHGEIETARSQGLSVPNTAVAFTTEGASVQVVENNVVRRQPIETGLIVGERVEVVGGLKQGAIVVQRAGTFLRDGDQIRTILPDAKVSEVR